MGFIEKVLPPAGKDAFAHKMMVQLKKRKIKGPFLYNREEFSLRAGSGSTVLFLANAYEEYSRAKLANREKVIRRFAEQAATVGSGMSKLPSDFAAAREKILPRVRERFFYESIRLSFAGQGKPVPNLPTLKLTDDLSVNLIYDSPDSVAMVDVGVLAQWKTEFPDALKIARENLWKISNENFEEPSPGLFVGPWKDNHAATRMFLHDLIWQLPVKGGSIFQGGHVVMVPNRDTLLVAGEQDEPALLAMAQRCEQALAEPRFMTGLAFILRGTTWHPFMPAEGTPARAAFEKLRLLTLSNWYGEQKKMLQPRANGVFIPTYTVATTQEGKMMSFATWGEGLEALLPDAEWIGLMGKPDATGKPKMYGFLSTEKARAAWPDLLEKTDHYPPRYRTKGFPTEAQIASIEFTKSPGA